MSSLYVLCFLENMLFLMLFPSPGRSFLAPLLNLPLPTEIIKTRNFQ